MSRPPDPQAGYTLLADVVARTPAPPVIIYAGSATPQQVATARAKGAFGCTNRPGELVQLVLQAVAAGSSS
jgi:CheY-like chemotaxis protein